MKSLSLHEIRRLAREERERFLFTQHAEEESLRRNIQRETVFETIARGTVTKRVPDEQTEGGSGGEFTKFTFHWRQFVLTVKNSPNPLILSIRLSE